METGQIDHETQRQDGTTNVVGVADLARSGEERIVVSDLPTRLPVMPEELQLVRAYFADLIDNILGG